MLHWLRGSLATITRRSAPGIFGGGLGWAASVTLLGTWLGRFDVIAKNVDVIAVVMVLVSVIPWGIEYLRRRVKDRRVKEEAMSAGE